MFSSLIEKTAINRNNELGFDARILSESVDKALNGIKLESYNIISINNAISFFKSIISYCERKHFQTDLGLSGAEAFNIFVKTVNNYKSIEDVKHVNIKNVELLEKIIDGKNEEERTEDLYEIITSLMNYHMGNNSESFMGDLGW